MSMKLVMAIALLALVLLGGFVFWKPIVVEYQLKRAEAHFRVSYSSASRYRVGTSDLEWVHKFGGTCGLNRLRDLAEDPSISPAGKEKIARWIPFIEQGGYVQYCADLRSDDWPFSAYDDYVMRLNQKMSPKPGPPGPTPTPSGRTK